MIVSSSLLNIIVTFSGNINTPAETTERSQMLIYPLALNRCAALLQDQLMCFRFPSSPFFYPFYKESHRRAQRHVFTL